MVMAFSNPMVLLFHSAKDSHSCQKSEHSWKRKLKLLLNHIVGPQMNSLA